MKRLLMPNIDFDYAIYAHFMEKQKKGGPVETELELALRFVKYDVANKRKKNWRKQRPNKSLIAVGKGYGEVITYYPLYNIYVVKAGNEDFRVPARLLETAFKLYRQKPVSGKEPIDRMAIRRRGLPPLPISELSIVSDGAVSVWQ